jgi:hypothetical protein
LQFAKDKVNNEWNEPGVCHFGDFCDYAHTNMEVLYHPELYKTRMCQVRQLIRSRAMVPWTSIFSVVALLARLLKRF